MAKKMTCKAAPEIEIEVDGGDSVLLRFDIQCISNIQEQEDGLKGLMRKKFSELAVTLVYCAAKENNENFTYDDAKKLVAHMSIENVKEIIAEFTSSIGVQEDEETTKKLLAQILGN